jgi:tetratricopeptide (TPR) repeat protein
LFDEVKKSHYEVLGIANTAAEAEIKKAYFGMVRKYQPDRSPEEFKEIRAAYETLMDRKKRADYDAINDLPPVVVPLFHDAQRFHRFGRLDKAAELYRLILKSHPELDKVREQYANNFYDDNKTGKAIEVWEELCRRNPGNPRYARELAHCYFQRGWVKKSEAETRRALDLDPSSIEGWTQLISCAVENIKTSSDFVDGLSSLVNKALAAVKDVKTEEWRKIYLHAQGFLAAGIRKVDFAMRHLREIIRLIREGGQEGRHEGQEALNEMLLIPPNSLAELYPDLKEMADLLPDISMMQRLQLDAVRLSFEIEGLAKKKIPDVFIDLFRILNAGYEYEDDELEVTAIEYHLLDDKKNYEPYVRRLKGEFPEIYDLHSSFFDDFLRVRDPEKMLRQRSRILKKSKGRVVFDEEDPESEQPVTVRRSQPKVGRNDPCPCGSGKKYKHCCGA